MVDWVPLMRLFLTTLVLSFTALLLNAERPNIVILLADDAGYSDFGCYGGEAETPNIDQLAAEGLKLTDFHAAAPNCSPSRTGLLTGRYPSRVGVYSYIPEQKEGLHPMHMPSSEVTLAELLKESGYQTAHTGKWHVSVLRTTQPQPSDQGFDYSFGTTNNAIPSHLNPVNFVRNGEPVGDVEGYACQIVVDDAIRWLNQKDEADPFFLYVAFHEPHEKIASPPEMVAQYSEGKKRNEYLANIQNLDDAVGRLLERLDQLGHREDTIVLFASDNGSLHDASNGGLRGQKSMLYEGGIREPGIIRWPAMIEAGRTSDATLNFVDLLPTFCSLAGVASPQDRTLDGVDFSPLLFGNENWERDQPLFWYFYRSIAGFSQRAQGMTGKMPAGAFRIDDWLLIGYLEHPNMPDSHAMVPSDMDFIRESTWEKFELYNLRTDRAQKKDLYNERRALVKRLSKEMAAIHASMVVEGPYWKWEDR